MLSEETTSMLLSTLQKRFEKHMHRHPGMQWKDVQARLEEQGGDAAYIANEMRKRRTRLFPDTSS